MLVFYPDFPVEAAAGGPDEDGVEVVVLLDASESMVGEAWLNARRIALEVLKALPPTARLNVMLFGTGADPSASRPLPPRLARPRPMSMMVTAAASKATA